MTMKGDPKDEMVKERYSKAKDVDPRPSVCVHHHHKASVLKVCVYPCRNESNA
jgi:hypothetical protein